MTNLAKSYPEENNDCLELFLEAKEEAVNYEREQARAVIKSRLIEIEKLKMLLAKAEADVEELKKSSISYVASLGQSAKYLP